jgi:Peptidase family S41
MLHRRKFLQRALSGVGSVWANSVWAGAGQGISRRVFTGPFSNDAQLVGEVLRTLHPGLHRYLTPAQADQKIISFQRAFSSTADSAQRYLLLSRLLAEIRCGHSYANFRNQSDAVAAQLFDRGNRLPFAFRWIERQMVVTQDQSGTGKVQPGSIVSTINDIPSHRILDRLLPYVRADGHNDAKRRALLSVTGRSRFETFDIFHGLIFGPPKSGEFELEVVHPGGKSARLKISTITLQQRQSFMKSSPADNVPAWDWRLTSDKIAILKMDNWGLYDSKWPWESWLNDRLDTLPNARSLIVDLRENEGGLDCGDPILARFAHADLRAAPEKRLLRYRKIPAALDPYLDTWDDSFRDRGDTVTRYDDRYFIQQYDAARDVIAAKRPQFKIPLVILTSAENSSATFQFANRARMAGFGTLIGEPTGGNRRGINGGSFFFVRLPQSGLEFDLPLIATYPDTAQPDSGLLPDIEVLTTADDIARGRDRAIQAALQFILRQKPVG